MVLTVACGIAEGCVGWQEEREACQGAGDYFLDCRLCIVQVALDGCHIELGWKQVLQ